MSTQILAKLYKKWHQLCRNRYLNVACENVETPLWLKLWILDSLVNSSPWPIARRILKAKSAKSVQHTHTHTQHTHTHIYIYIYMVNSISFQTFLYRHLKLSQTLENSVCYCYTSYQVVRSYFSNFKTDPFDTKIGT